ncbi:MAG: hypothetical protein LBR61_12240 [Synergistaceae bacterium]|jgi:ribulose-bisphosphate carboxylase large chain|nr:hypothetical protein [Synergistaceae bacterium]
MFFEDHDDARTRSLVGGGRFLVLYRLYADNEQAARERAEDICTEQTVEFPVPLLPPGAILSEVRGRLENLEKEREGQYLASVSFADETAAGEFTQFLDVIFGNISIKPGIQVVRIHPGRGVRSFLRGPRFGVKGIRALLGVPRRPLLFTALKPMGLSSSEMARLAAQFVEGGVDIVKDDHGLTNQVFAPFEERVALCAAAVRESAAKLGRKALYVPNVTAPASQLPERVQRARELGAGGLLVSPGLTGLDAVREISERTEGELPIFTHPAFLGSYALTRQGIAADLLFGTFMRMAGADATIFPNCGGRFPLSKEDCLGIAAACRENPENFEPIFPAPAGGMELGNIDDMRRTYGDDMLVLVGGGLFTCGGDLVENCRRFRAALER